MRDYQYPLDLDWSTDEIVVPSIGEERRLGRDFEDLSGYSLYRTVQAAKTTSGKLKMKE